MKKPRRPPPTALEDTSFFEFTQTRQEAIQARVLRESGRTARLATDLADATHAHASSFLEEKVAGPASETDCQSGCAFCCHQPATIFPFEAVRIAQVLKSSLTAPELSAVVEKMKARVRGLQGTSVRQNLNNKTACPLLSREQSCSIYEHRPLTCRLAHSYSVKRCRQSFEGNRAKVQIPISLPLQTGIGGIIEGVFAGLPKHQLDGQLYELCSAVLVALADPDAVAQTWSDGNARVFQGCVKDDT